MARFLARTAKVAFVAVAGYLLWCWERSRRTGAQIGGGRARRSSERPAQVHIPSQIVPPGGPETSSIAASWVEPVGADCPASHPVKATLADHVFFVLGDPGYERTSAERCYVDPGAAEADGFRRADS